MSLTFHHLPSLPVTDQPPRPAWDVCVADESVLRITSHPEGRVMGLIPCNYSVSCPSGAPGVGGVSISGEQVQPQSASALRRQTGQVPQSLGMFGWVLSQATG